MNFRVLSKARILTNPREDWNRISSLARGKSRTAFKENKIDWKQFTPDKYLLTDCVIVSSVNVEADGHTITPKSSKYVNANGNGWSTPVLKMIYKTFAGAENYYEHIQIPELSKGKILDAVLREVIDEEGEKVLYCNILVATDRRHVSLVDRIERGELSTLSMGCIADVVQCSQCGKIIRDEDKNCEHLDNDILQFYTDNKGIRRVVAELCGVIGEPNSCRFIEASWVEKPAFPGATLNHFISQIPDKLVACNLGVEKMANLWDFRHLKVADVRGRIVADLFKSATERLEIIRKLENSYNFFK